MTELEPEVWRQLVVPWYWTLAHLHLGIQAAFGWQDCHLHEFRIGGLRFGDLELLVEGPQRGDEARVFDSRDVRMRDFREGAIFEYVYDFGDNWTHVVEVEEQLFLDIAPKHATCIAGARAAPPDDVGGPPGYERFVAAMSDPRHPDHREMRRWYGGPFDPEWCDLAVVDKDVRGALRANARRRVRQPKGKPS